MFKTDLIRTLKLMAAAAIASISHTEARADVEFCYADLNEPQYIWGTEKKEHYDLAVRIKGESFAGAQVTGLKAYFPAQNYSGVTGWASSELKLESKKNAPDLCTRDAVVEDHMMTVVFDTPVEVPEEGVYVGYSFTIDALEAEADSYPVPVTMGFSTDGFLIHTDRTFLKWKDVSEYLGGAVLSLIVTMQGDFGEANVAISADREQFAPLDKQEWTMPANLTSTGSQPISSLELTLNAEGAETVVVTKEFSPALRPQFGTEFPVEFSFPVNFSPGDHEASLTVSKVNGLENAAAGKSADFLLHALARLVTKRPLMEEYTGLWCSNCPRGYAAMEYMAKTYPEDFVGAVYHTGLGANEEMQVIPDEELPAYVYAIPDAWLDRSINLDPYFGTSGSGFGMPADWQAQREKFSPVEIATTGSLEDGVVAATATATFMYRTEADCDIEFLLLADGLTSPSWRQRNSYYTDNPAKYSLPELQAFCKGGEYGSNNVMGLVYNDVVIGTSGRLPLMDAVDMVTDQPLESHWSFGLADAVSNKGVALAPLAAQFRIVAVVCDRADGSVLNCTSSAPMANTSGISSALEEGAGTGVYFDLQGRRIAAPARGLSLRIAKGADGSYRCEKVMVR